MNYKEMSDFEINKRIERITSMYCEDCDGRYMPNMDYCNNPSDALPIIMENKMTVMPWNNKEWQAFIMKDGDPAFRVRDTNPLRAAMIVFLMMRDQQCQKN